MMWTVSLVCLVKFAGPDLLDKQVLSHLKKTIKPANKLFFVGSLIASPVWYGCLSRYLNQETVKGPFRSSSQVATCYYLPNQ